MEKKRITPEYSLRATKAYQMRRKAKGWITYGTMIPAEMRDRLKAFRDELVAEYNSTHEEAK
jgi:hypothetical protein